MEPEDWIALAAVGLTALTVFLSYKQAKQGHEHARGLARDDRMFEARRAAYEGALLLVQHRWAQIDRDAAPIREGEAPAEPFAPAELTELLTRLKLYASPAVLRKVTDLEGPLGSYAFEVGRLRATEELVAALEADAVPDRLREQLAAQREDVAREAQRVREALDALARVMQEHVEGRAAKAA